MGLLVGILVASNVERIRDAINRTFDANLFPSQLYFLSHLPSRIEPGDVVLVVVLTILLSVLATLYPSWRAATLAPVDTLRYE